MKPLKGIHAVNPEIRVFKGFCSSIVMIFGVFLLVSGQGLIREAKAAENGSSEMDIVKNSFGPNLSIKGFADLNFVSEQPPEGETGHPNTFSLGQVDLFMTSEISNNTHLLMELVFEGDHDNEIETDLERLILQYSLSPHLRIKLGRMHTDFGYWNSEYHHGRWFQSSAFRPKFFGFEDEQGLLPIHSTGIYLHGTKEFRVMDLKYGLGLSNGRGKTRTEIQGFQDANDFKALNSQFRLSSNQIRGLSLGFSTYFDRIPKDPLDPFRTEEIKESIWGGHVVYKRKGIEVLNEFAWISHDDLASDLKYESLGYYLQISYEVGPVRPYYRLEYSDLDQFNPYWADLPPYKQDYTENLIGFKWDVNLWSALKIEYRYNNHRDFSNTNDLIIQSSFTF